MKALLLSIKPQYVDKILRGVKTFEYRKRLAKEDVSVIYVYCTAPIKKVVAVVQVVGKLSDSPVRLWEKTKTMSGISRDKYDEYFSGCKIAHAYELGKVDIFKEGKNLSDFGINVAPQSYAYVDMRETLHYSPHR